MIYDELLRIFVQLWWLTWFLGDRWQLWHAWIESLAQNWVLPSGTSKERPREIAVRKSFEWILNISVGSLNLAVEHSVTSSLGDSHLIRKIVAFLANKGLLWWNSNDLFICSDVLASHSYANLRGTEHFWHLLLVVAVPPDLVEHWLGYWLPLDILSTTLFDVRKTFSSLFKNIFRFKVEIILVRHPVIKGHSVRFYCFEESRVTPILRNVMSFREKWLWSSWLWTSWEKLKRFGLRLWIAFLLEKLHFYWFI